VADVLLGRAPFTGKLPVSWPRTLAQEPINVGDPGYDPAFPYGWGLTTR
jgi:beta-glucosidase